MVTNVKQKRVGARVCGKRERERECQLYEKITRMRVTNGQQSRMIAVAHAQSAVANMYLTCPGRCIFIPMHKVTHEPIKRMRVFADTFLSLMVMVMMMMIVNCNDDAFFFAIRNTLFLLRARSHTYATLTY